MQFQLNYLLGMGNHEIKTWDTKQRVLWSLRKIKKLHHLRKQSKMLTFQNQWVLITKNIRIQVLRLQGFLAYQISLRLKIWATTKLLIFLTNQIIVQQLWMRNHGSSLVQNRSLKMSQGLEVSAQSHLRKLFQNPNSKF